MLWGGREEGGIVVGGRNCDICLEFGACGMFRRQGCKKSVMSLYSFRLNELEKDEMGGVCSTYRGEKSLCRVLAGKLRERDHWEDPCLDGRMILR
jgi:hypothetical protein